MLCAQTRYTAGPVDFQFDFALERTFRLLAVRRTATMLDTRLSPPNGTPSNGQSIVYVVLDGMLQWNEPDTLHVRSGAFVAPLEDVVGGSGKRTRSYCSGGRLFRSLELWVPTALLPRGLPGPARVDLSAETMRAANNYATMVHAGGRASVEDRAVVLARFFGGLQRDGVLLTDLTSAIVTNEGFQGTIWQHCVPLIEPLALCSSLDALANRAGVSLRQMGRRLDDLITTFELPFTGWRSLARGLRLRLAVVLLSNPALTIASIAEAAGYSSAEALNHAFRDDGLPAPFEIRKRLLALQASLSGPSDPDITQPATQVA